MESSNNRVHKLLDISVDSLDLDRITQPTGLELSPNTEEDTAKFADNLVRELINDTNQLVNKQLSPAKSTTPTAQLISFLGDSEENQERAEEKLQKPNQDEEVGINQDECRSSVDKIEPPVGNIEETETGKASAIADVDKTRDEVKESGADDGETNLLVGDSVLKTEEIRTDVEKTKFEAKEATHEVEEPKTKIEQSELTVEPEVRVEETRTELEETEPVVELAEAKVEEIDTVIKETRSMVEEPKSEVNESKIASIYAEVGESKTGIEETELEIKETKAEIEETKAEIEETEAEIEEIEARVEETEAEVEHNTNQMYQIGAQVEETKAEVEQTKAEVEHTEIQVEQTKGEDVETKGDITDIKGEIDASKGETDDSKDETDDRGDEKEYSTEPSNDRESGDKEVETVREEVVEKEREETDKFGQEAQQSFRTAGCNSLFFNEESNQEDLVEVENMEFTKNYSDDLLLGHSNDTPIQAEPQTSNINADLADYELPPYSGSSSGSEPRQQSPIRERKESSSTIGKTSSKQIAAQPSSSHQADVAPPDLAAIKNLLISGYSRVSHVFQWKNPIETGVYFSIGFLLIIALTFFSIISVFAYSTLGIILASSLLRVYKYVLTTLNKSSKTPFDDVWNQVLSINVSVSSEKVHEILDASLSNLNASSVYLKQVLLVEDKIATLKFGLFIYLLTYIGAWFNGMTLITLVYLALFSVPLFYQKNKTKIDEYINLATGQLSSSVSLVTNKVTSMVFGSSASGSKSKKQN